MDIPYEGIITAEMIADSISYDGPDDPIRICSIKIRQPRIIHSEFMTHRVFGRNARSSRAVPTKRLLQEDPFIPLFGMNMPGMQAGEEASDELQAKWEREWLELAQLTREYVARWNEDGMHKQWANRPLEWFGFIDVVVTSTKWANFFHLRDHKDAMPEIKAVAQQVKKVMDSSSPIVRQSWNDENERGWHLPYITDTERQIHSLELLQKASAARCARISYRPFDMDKIDIESDLVLFNEKLCSDPMHASPLEHQACPDSMINIPISGGSVEIWENHQEHGNLHGWRQFRKMIPNENYPD